MNEIARSATSLALPWPPSVNAYKMPVKMGKTIVLVLTKRARTYRLEVAEAIAKQLGRRSLIGYDCRVQIDIELRAPDRRARDIDNHAKMLLDGLVAAGILKDDSLIDVLNMRRGQMIKDGCANVLISPLDPQPDLPQEYIPLLDREDADAPF